MVAIVPRLLLVTNRFRAVKPLPELTRAALAGGVNVVQVREKDLGREELRRLLAGVVEAAGDPTKVMVNGDAALATEFGIGLHLPEYAPIERPSGAGLLSRAVHDSPGAATTVAVDFAVAGHVFETASKPGRPPIGPSGLCEIVAVSPVPIVAIGGIAPERVGAVLSAGAVGIAVMSAINDAEDPESAARAFYATIERNA